MKWHVVNCDVVSSNTKMFVNTIKGRRAFQSINQKNPLASGLLHFFALERFHSPYKTAPYSTSFKQILFTSARTFWGFPYFALKYLTVRIHKRLRFISGFFKYLCSRQISLDRILDVWCNVTLQAFFWTFRKNSRFCQLELMIFSIQKTTLLN